MVLGLCHRMITISPVEEVVKVVLRTDFRRGFFMEIYDNGLDGRGKCLLVREN